ncbi:MAG TPA: hypothetical protein DCM62_03585 [Bacteroidales bacterium]|nr:hypothetical protein [Bacteroidales bacterium]
MQIGSKLRMSFIVFNFDRFIIGKKYINQCCNIAFQIAKVQNNSLYLACKTTNKFDIKQGFFGRN